MAIRPDWPGLTAEISAGVRSAGCRKWAKDYHKYIKATSSTSFSIRFTINSSFPDNYDVMMHAILDSAMSATYFDFAHKLYEPGGRFLEGVLKNNEHGHIVFQKFQFHALNISKYDSPLHINFTGRTTY
jgi:hypothetical protein